MHGAVAALESRARGTYMPITKLRIARGLKANLPHPPNSFEPGRPYFCTDTHELFIGTGLSTAMESVALPAGESNVDVMLTVGMNINAYQTVTVHSDGLAYTVDSGSASDAGKIVGIAVTSATLGSQVTVRMDGEVDNNGFLFTPGDRIYVGSAGALTNSPNTGVFEQPVGLASATGTLLLDIGLPILTA
jgi:hypothetical protein